MWRRGVLSPGRSNIGPEDLDSALHHADGSAPEQDRNLTGIRTKKMKWRHKLQVWLSHGRTDVGSYSGEVQVNCSSIQAAGR